VKSDVVLTEYPDAQHGFDAGLAGNSSVLVAAGSQTVRHCHIREAEGGVLLNADTETPFSYRDSCVEFGPHVGGNPVAAEAARKAVVEFLQGLFKLG
jgi:dienelactone hydrolase